MLLRFGGTLMQLAKAGVFLFCVMACLSCRHAASDDSGPRSVSGGSWNMLCKGSSATDVDSDGNTIVRVDDSSFHFFIKVHPSRASSESRVSVRVLPYTTPTANDQFVDYSMSLLQGAHQTMGVEDSNFERVAFQATVSLRNRETLRLLLPRQIKLDEDQVLIAEYSLSGKTRPIKCKRLGMHD